MEEASKLNGWHDQPPEPGLYYYETCDRFGNPIPGMAVWEEGKEWVPSSLPAKYWGPIRGAMKKWETVPA